MLYLIKYIVKLWLLLVGMRYDPKAPKNYLSQGDFRKDFDKKVDAVRGGSMTVRKQRF